jgi:hypothetical protein
MALWTQVGGSSNSLPPIRRKEKLLMHTLSSSLLAFGTTLAVVFLAANMVLLTPALHVVGDRVAPAALQIA